MSFPYIDNSFWVAFCWLCIGLVRLAADFFANCWLLADWSYYCGRFFCELLTFGRLVVLLRPIFFKIVEYWARWVRFAADFFANCWLFADWSYYCGRFFCELLTFGRLVVLLRPIFFKIVEYGARWVRLALGIPPILIMYYGLLPTIYFHEVADMCSQVSVKKMGRHMISSGVELVLSTEIIFHA
jgi:hypothetical protein